MINAVELAMSARILVVDDEETNLRLLRRILAHDGYQHVHSTRDARGLADLVDEFQPDLILLDLHMPPPDGFDVMRSLGTRITGAGQVAVLVLTGDSSSEAKRAALSLGARDFLCKPFDTTEALLRIRNLLETRFLHRELADQNARLETRVQERTSALEQSQVEILERLARTAEIRDDETGRHTQRVAGMAGTLAEALGLEPRMVELIRRAAPLHDVGKIGIPDNILRKPGLLTADETAVMRTHTLVGARILSGGRSDLMMVAERIALSHHEHWDGSGYPHGLKGDAIPVEARIVALADFIDALTHNRPYRPAWPADAVFDEIRRCSGSHFDPRIVEALMSSEIAGSTQEYGPGVATV
jgi:putative two-component system response regulator